MRRPIAKPARLAVTSRCGEEVFAHLDPRPACTRGIVMRIKSPEVRGQEQRITVSPAILIEARRRGIKTTTLAAIFNVSHQRIQQLIGRTGGTRSGHRGQRPLTCPCCDTVRWVPSRHSKKRGYCSPKCFGLGERLLSSDDCAKAAELREQGYAWKRIAHIFGRDVQTVQTAIWRWLYEDGRLNDRELSRYWYSTTGNVPASWAWIEKAQRRRYPIDRGLLA